MGGNHQVTCDGDGGYLTLGLEEAFYELGEDENTVRLLAGSGGPAADRTYFFVAREGGRTSETVAARPYVLRFDRAVRDTTVAGNHVFAGGGFTQLRVRTGGGVAVDATAGTPVDGLPTLEGGTGGASHVHAVLPDGDGGWIVGGNFEQIGGVTQPHLARVDDQGAVDRDWRPEVSGQVHALDQDGDTLYIGGDFTRIEGEERYRLAALDLDTASLRDWRPRLELGGTDTASVRTVDVQPETDTVFVGGNFSRVWRRPDDADGDYDTQHGITAFHSDSGARREGFSYPALPSGGELAHIVDVHETDVHDGDVVFVGSSAEQGLQAFWGPEATEQGRGNEIDIPPDLESVHDLLVVDGHLYTAGEGGVRAFALGEVGTGDWLTEDTGRVPSFNDSVHALSWNPQEEWLYAGGDFSSADGEPRAGTAAFDLEGNRQNWHPGASGPVTALAYDAQRVYIGGGFEKAGGYRRPRLVALERDSGRVALDWAPEIDGTVRAVQATEDALYIGGDFERVAGEDHAHLAQFRHDRDLDLDADTPRFADQPGEAFPPPNRTVYALAATEDYLYAGGAFNRVDDEDGHHLAAFEVRDRKPRWSREDPELDDYVRALTLSDGYVYAGGTFSSAAGQDGLGRLARFSAGADLSLDTDWEAGVDSTVRALATDDKWIYAGGEFLGARGAGATDWIDRTYAAAFSMEGEASLSDWAPDLEGEDVRALATAADHDAVYIGGAFEAPASHLIAYQDASTTAPRRLDGWSANVDGSVQSLELGTSQGTTWLFAGGSFREIGGELRDRLAAIRADAGAEDGADIEW